MNTERNKPKQLSSGCVGVLTALLATSFAFSQTEATEPTGRGSGSEVSAQPPTGTTSAADADAAIIQELDRMRNRIKALESQLKQRHAGTTIAADSTKAATATAEQFVSGSDSSSKAAAQTESPASRSNLRIGPG